MRLPSWLALGFLLLATARAFGQAPAPEAQTPAPAAAPATAATQPAASSEGAKEHFKRGEAAYEKGNYTLAISEWQAAYTIEARPRIQYNIYQALERLGQLPEASAALQRYLSTADPDDPSYADATARMSALQQRLQATGIRLVGGPEGAAVNVSGHDWGMLPRPDRIPVQPGNHRVVITLAGHKDFVTNVVVPPGQVVDVPVQLEATAPAAPQPTAHAAGSSADATPFFVASGVLGAGMIGSLIWTLNRAGEIKGCSDPNFFCKNRSAVATQRTIAIGLTATLGVAAIATLVYGVVLSGQSEEHAALCVPTGTGATCAVHF
ncbi:MAG: PEGA domain-containing protein [Polyangiales bacterium]